MNPKQTKQHEKSRQQSQSASQRTAGILSTVIAWLAYWLIGVKSAAGSLEACTLTRFLPDARRVSATIETWWHSLNFISRRTLHTVTRTADGAITPAIALMRTVAEILKPRREYSARRRNVFVAAFLCLLLVLPLPAFGDGGATYTYDELGRLVKVTFVDGTTIKYSYDENGNRTSTLVCCSDEAKFTTGDAISDFLVTGLVATTPTALTARSDSSLELPNSISLSDDDSLLWINTTKDLGSGQTAYDVLAFGSSDFSSQADCSSGTALSSEGISTLTIPDSNVTLSAVKVSGGTGHAFFPVTASSCGTGTGLAAANIFAALSPDGTKAAFALANDTVALSSSSDNFATVTSSISVSPNPISIVFDSTGTALWVSYAGTSVIEKYDLSGTLLVSFDLTSSSPDYEFMRVSGDSLIITSSTDKKIFVIDTTVPAISQTFDLSTISPKELVLRGERAYVLGLDSTDSHYKIVRFTIGESTFAALDTGLTAPTAGLAVNSTETHAYTVSGGTPALTHDYVLPSDVIPAGVAYVEGLRVVTANTPHTFTPSKDTYQFLQSNGTNHFVEVANGATQPTDTGLLISKTVTNSLGITQIAQIAPSAPTITGQARSGANSDITSLSGLTTPLSLNQGGTGSDLSSELAGSLMYIDGLGGTTTMPPGAPNTIPLWNGTEWVAQTFGVTSTVAQTAAEVPTALTMQNAATGTGNGTNLNVQGYSVAVINVTGSWAGTITFEISADGTTWVPAAGVDPMGKNSATASTTTANGSYAFNVAGFKNLRARVSSYTSGSITALGYLTPLGTVTAHQRVWSQSGDLKTSIEDGSGNVAGVTAGGALKVDGSAVTQPVSAASLPLPTGAATSAKQPGLGTAGSASSDVITVQGVSGMTALKVDGSAVTQPVSAASLPLPTGAATSAKQPALGTAGSASSDVITVQGVSGMTALKVDGSAVTQPVSAASLPLPSGAATSAKQPALGTAGSAAGDVLTVQGISSMTPLKVDGSAVTQPVSGSIGINAGSNVIGGVKLIDAAGTNAAAISAGGVLSIGDVNVKLEDAPSGSGDIGTLVLGVRNDSQAALTSSDGDYSGIAVDSAGRVQVTDGAGSLTVDGTVAATQSGTWTVQPGNTANTTPWLTTINQGGNSANVTASNALKVDGSAVTQPVSVAGTVAATQSGSWNIGSITTLPALPTGTNTIGSVKITDGTETANVNASNALEVAIVSGGSGGTQYTEDAAHSSGDTGTLSLAIRNDSVSTFTSTNGDYSGLSVDYAGRVNAAPSYQENEFVFQNATENGNGNALDLYTDRLKYRSNQILFEVSNNGGGSFNATVNFEMEVGSAEWIPLKVSQIAGTGSLGNGGTTTTSTGMYRGVTSGAQAVRARISNYVSGTVSVLGTTDDGTATNPLIAIDGTVPATQSGTWNVNNISGTVSLPTGASTAAKQPALGTAGSASADVLTVQGISGMTALKVDGSATTQPVNQTQINGTAVSAGNGSTDSGTQRVVLSNDNQSTVKTGAGSLTRLTADAGGTPVAFGNGSTGTDTMRVVLSNDNQSTVKTGAGSLTRLTSDAGGTPVAFGNGSTGTDTMRVVLSNDNQSTVKTGAGSLIRLTSDSSGTPVTFGNGSTDSNTPRTTLSNDFQSTGKFALIDTTNSKEAAVTTSNALKVDGSAVSQPVNLQVSNTAVSIGNGSAGGLGDVALRVTIASDSTGQVKLAAGSNAIGSLGAGSATIGAVKLTDGTNTAAIGVSGNLKVDGSAVTQPISASSLPLPSGGATSAKQPTIGAAGSASSDVLTVQGIASMTALKVDGSAAIQPVSGTVATNSERAEDAAHSSGQTGNFVLGVRNDSNAALTGTDGDYSPIATNDKGAVAIQDGGNSITVDGTVTANQGGSNWSVNLAQVGGASTSTNNGTAGAGVQRVTIASDSTGNITTIGTSITPGTSATHLGKAEDAAHVSSDTGVMMLGVRNDDGDTSLSGADGDYTPIATTSQGHVKTVIETSSKSTYMVSSPFQAAPATPTDLAIINGSGTKTIKVLRVEMFAKATSNTQQQYFLIKRSAANTGGTSTSVTPVPIDSNNAAATATYKYYSANPSLGTAVGTLAQPALQIGTATAGVPVSGMCYVLFDEKLTGQPIVLRGTAEGLAINFGGAALPSGLNCAFTITFTEE